MEQLRSREEMRSTNGVVSLDGNQIGNAYFNAMRIAKEKHTNASSSIVNHGTQTSFLLSKNNLESKIHNAKTRYAVAQSQDAKNIADVEINFFTKLSTDPVIPQIVSIFPEYHGYHTDIQMYGVATSVAKIKQDTLADVLTYKNQSDAAFFETELYSFEENEAMINSSTGDANPRSSSINVAKQNVDVKVFPVKYQFMTTRYELANVFTELSRQAVGLSNIVDELARKQRMSERVHTERMVLNSILKGSGDKKSLLSLARKANASDLMSHVGVASIQDMSTPEHGRKFVEYISNNNHINGTIIKGHLVFAGVDYKKLCEVLYATSGHVVNVIQALTMRGFTISVCNLLDKNNAYVKNENVFNTHNRMFCLAKRNVIVKSAISPDTIFAIQGGMPNELLQTQIAIGYSQFSETYEMYDGSAEMYSV